jgi:hypothetical protein
MDLVLGSRISSRIHARQALTSCAIRNLRTKVRRPSKRSYLALACRLGLLRQGERARQPGAVEEGQCLGCEAEIAFELLQLARQSVELAREGRLPATAR